LKAGLEIRLAHVSEFRWRRLKTFELCQPVGRICNRCRVTWGTIRSRTSSSTASGSATAPKTMPRDDGSAPPAGLTSLYLTNAVSADVNFRLESVVPPCAKFWPLA